MLNIEKNKDGILKIYHVKAEKIDGKNIKEDIYYCLYNKKFHEVVEFDNIKSAVISKKGNVFKVCNFGEREESYIVKNGDIYSHGKTIKEAKADLIYKISNRDKSEYESMTLKTILTKKEYIEMYRVITGACGLGTKNFCDGNKKLKAKMTIKEIIEITKGQYGNKEIKDFFKKG